MISSFFSTFGSLSRSWGAIGYFLLLIIVVLFLVLGASADLFFFPEDFED